MKVVLRSMKTILWKVFYVIFMFFMLLLLPLALILRKLLPDARYRYFAYVVGSAWSRITIRSTGSKVRMEGLENIPDDARLCFIGNHQSLFDIPAFLGYVGRPVGFVAKQELFRVPALSQWMRQLPCVFIDRDNARQAMITFQSSAELIRKGHPLVIFPEGGRSEPDILRKFHLGSLKLAKMADATIVPFAIKDSWRIMEIDGHIHAAMVRIRVLPPVSPNDPLYSDNIKLAGHLEQIIGENMKGE